MGLPVALPFILRLVIGVGLLVLSYAIQAKLKTDTGETQEMDDPTAEAGKPIPVPFGTTIITEPNILWYGDKHTVERDA